MLTIILTAPEAPPPPREVDMADINSTSAIVRWDPVPLEITNGPVISYTVNYRISAPMMGSSKRKKRQIVDGILVQDCVMGGAENVDRNTSVGGNETSVKLQMLSELLKS